MVLDTGTVRALCPMCWALASQFPSRWSRPWVWTQCTAVNPEGVLSPSLALSHPLYPVCALPSPHVCGLPESSTELGTAGPGLRRVTCVQPSQTHPALPHWLFYRTPISDDQVPPGRTGSSPRPSVLLS
ncbi:hypothetical protein HJG60_008872 [Phyllostomus discolor]|uniref:Uncharacterized protein n=1 Tax=Phyllostomus discolor TaxID=89673 RepID=A0A833YZM4_9CHIR|nr:hypothetical protein HJG60_008872 [Phyllostomus discolor]